MNSMKIESQNIENISDIDRAADVYLCLDPQPNYQVDEVSTMVVHSGQHVIVDGTKHPESESKSKELQDVSYFNFISHVQPGGYLQLQNMRYGENKASIQIDMLDGGDGGEVVLRNVYMAFQKGSDIFGFTNDATAGPDKWSHTAGVEWPLRMVNCHYLLQDVVFAKVDTEKCTTRPMISERVKVVTIVKKPPPILCVEQDCSVQVGQPVSIVGQAYNQLSGSDQPIELTMSLRIHANGLLWLKDVLMIKQKTTDMISLMDQNAPSGGRAWLTAVHFVWIMGGPPIERFWQVSDQYPINFSDCVFMKDDFPTALSAQFKPYATFHHDSNSTDPLQIILTDDTPDHSVRSGSPNRISIDLTCIHGDHFNLMCEKAKPVVISGLRNNLNQRLPKLCPGEAPVSGSGSVHLVSSFYDYLGTAFNAKAISFLA